MLAHCYWGEKKPSHIYPPLSAVALDIKHTPCSQFGNLKHSFLAPRIQQTLKILVLLWCSYLILQLVSKFHGVWWWVVWCGQWEEEAFSGRTKLQVTVSSEADWKHSAEEWSNRSRMQFHLTKLLRTNNNPLIWELEDVKMKQRKTCKLSIELQSVLLRVKKKFYCLGCD